MAKQFWNKKHTRVLRVQQSLSSCKYRVVSIRPEQAESSWASGATPPSWATDWSDDKGAVEQLYDYAEKNQLEPYQEVRK